MKREGILPERRDLIDADPARIAERLQPVEESLRVGEGQMLDLFDGVPPDEWREMWSEIVHDNPPVLTLVDTENQRRVPGAASPDVEFVGPGVRVMYEGSIEQFFDDPERPRSDVDPPLVWDYGPFLASVRVV